MQDHLDYRAIGRRVRDLRIASGLTQEELAEMVGISVSFVGHIERGEKKFSLETTRSLASCLGVTLDYIVLGMNNRCGQQSCPLYTDLRKLMRAYGDEQEHFPRVYGSPELTPDRQP